MIRFACPKCAAPLSVKPELAGRQGACPKCKSPVRVPSPNDEPLVLAPAEPATPSAETSRRKLPPLSKQQRQDTSPRRPTPPAVLDEKSVGNKKVLWVILGGIAGAAVAGIAVVFALQGSGAPTEPEKQVVAKTEPRPTPTKTTFQPGTWPGGIPRGVITFQPPGAVIAQETRKLDDGKLLTNAVVCLPDNRVLIADSKGGMRLLDWTTGATVQSLSGHAKAVHHLAATPDGRRAISGAADGTARCWDLVAGKELGKIDGHPSGVASVAISPDGRTAVSCNYYATKEQTPNLMFVWDCDTGAKIGELTGTKEDPILKAFFYIDGRQLLLVRGKDRGAAAGQRIVLWDPVTKEEQLFLEAKGVGHLGNIDYIVPVKNGERLVTRSQKAIVVVEAKSARPLLQIEMPPGAYSAFDVTADGKFAINGGGAAPAGMPMPGPGGPFPGPGGPLGPGGPNGPGGPMPGPGPVPLILIDLETGKEVCRFTPKFPNPFHKASFTRDGQYLVSIGGRDVLLWTLPGEQKGANPLPAGKETPERFIPPKELPRTQGIPKDPEEEPWPEFARHNWELRPKVPHAVPKLGDEKSLGNLGPMTHLASLPQGRFAGITYQNELTMWGDPAAPQRKEAIARFRNLIEHFTVSADGRRALVAVQRDGTIMSHDLAKPGEGVRFVEHRGPISSVACSTDGQRALTCNWPPADGQNAAMLWNAANGNLIASAFGSPDDPILKAFFHPDGRRVLLARGARNGPESRLILQVWDPEKNEAEFFLNARRVGHSGGVSAVFSRAEGKQLVTCGTREVAVIDVEKRAPLRVIQFPPPTQLSVFDMAPDGMHLLCTGRIAGLRSPQPMVVLNIETGAEVMRFDTGAFISAAFTPDGKHIAAISRHSPPSLWPLAIRKNE